MKKLAFLLIAIISLTSITACTTDEVKYEAFEFPTVVQDSVEDETPVTPEKVLKFTIKSFKTKDEVYKKMFTYRLDETVSIPNGSTFEYDVYFENDEANLGLLFPLFKESIDFNVVNEMTDSFGVSVNPGLHKAEVLDAYDFFVSADDFAYKNWFHRSIEIPDNDTGSRTVRGLTITTGDLELDCEYTVYLANIVLKDSEGNIVREITAEEIAGAKFSIKDVEFSFEVVDDPAPEIKKGVNIQKLKLGDVTVNEKVDVSFEMLSENSAPMLYVGTPNSDSDWGFDGYIFSLESGKNELWIYKVQNSLEKTGIAEVNVSEGTNRMGFAYDGTYLEGYFLDDEAGLDKWPELAAYADMFSGKEVEYGLVNFIGDGIKVVNVETKTLGSEVANKDNVKLGKATVYDKKGEGGLDYILEFPEGMDIKIMQLADIQTINFKSIRTVARFRDFLGLSTESFNFIKEGGLELLEWRYIREAYEKGQPDIVVLTGDNIQGDTDDGGSAYLDMIELLDSHEIPWLIVHGNHDPECNLGTSWMTKQLMKSDYCVFRQGEVSGFSNYNVLLKQGDESKYLFYMFDTHGANFWGAVEGRSPDEGLLETNPDFDNILQGGATLGLEGLHDDQLEWFKTSAETIQSAEGKEIPSLLFMHIPPSEVYDAQVTKYPDTCSIIPFYPDQEGDLGRNVDSGVVGGFNRNNGFWETIKAAGTVGTFHGHAHGVQFSIVYDGIRITFGNTLMPDYSYPENGWTIATINEEDNSYGIEYFFSEYDSPFDVKTEE